MLQICDLATPRWSQSVNDSQWTGIYFLAPAPSASSLAKQGCGKRKRPVGGKNTIGMGTLCFYHQLNVFPLLGLVQ